MNRLDPIAVTVHAAPNLLKIFGQIHASPEVQAILTSADYRGWFVFYSTFFKYWPV